MRKSAAAFNSLPPSSSNRPFEDLRFRFLNLSTDMIHDTQLLRVISQEQCHLILPYDLLDGSIAAEIENCPVKKVMVSRARWVFA